MKGSTLALALSAVGAPMLAYASDPGTGYGPASCCCSPEHSSNCTNQTVSHADPVKVIVDVNGQQQSAGNQATGMSGTADTGVNFGTCKKVKYTFWCAKAGSSWQCTLSSSTVITVECP